MKTAFSAPALVLALAAFAAPAFAGGEFGHWRAPSDHAPASASGSSASYNPSVNGTAGSGQDTKTEGDAISARDGLDNASLNMGQITSSGQASPQGTPGGNK